MMRPLLSLCLVGAFLQSAHAAGVADLSAGDLVITELHPDPAATVYFRGQWFEVYNGAGESVDLNGLVVSNDSGESFTVSSSVTVADGAYALFAVRASPSANGGLPTVDVVYSTADLSISARDTLTIGFGGTTIDTVTYTGANFPSTGGTSISLSPSSLNATDNDTGSNWCGAESVYGDGDYGTPGATNDACPSPLSALSTGDLIITEVHFEPAASDFNKGEWFEIYNASSTYVDLDGLVIDGSTSDPGLTVSGTFPLRSGEYAVFAARDNPDQNGGLPQVDYRYIYSTELDLLATDELTLSFGVTTFDTVDWDSATFPGSSGTAMQLGTPSYDELSNDTGSNWCDATSFFGDGDLGTPGAENGDCNTDTDGDGFDEASDCDDNDSNTYPGADETCDGIDNDCDENIDENPTDGSTYYADVDDDLYGDP
ncbi:MAG: lamin tail domain-containing protein, partial [Myxococcota bacterium]